MATEVFGVICMQLIFNQFCKVNTHHTHTERKYGKILTVESGWINKCSLYYSFNFLMFEIFHNKKFEKVKKYFLP